MLRVRWPRLSESKTEWLSLMAFRFWLSTNFCDIFAKCSRCLNSGNFHDGSLTPCNVCWLKKPPKNPEMGHINVEIVLGHIIGGKSFVGNSKVLKRLIQIRQPCLGRKSVIEDAINKLCRNFDQTEVRLTFGLCEKRLQKFEEEHGFAEHQKSCLS